MTIGDSNAGDDVLTSSRYHVVTRGGTTLSRRLRIADPGPPSPLARDGVDPPRRLAVGILAARDETGTNTSHADDLLTIAGGMRRDDTTSDDRKNRVKVDAAVNKPFPDQSTILGPFNSGVGSMLSRLKRLHKLVADAEARLVSAKALADAVEARGEDSSKVRHAIVALTLALEHHRSARNRTQAMWDRIRPVQQALDARKGTVWGRQSTDREND